MKHLQDYLERRKLRWERDSSSIIGEAAREDLLAAQMSDDTAEISRILKVVSQIDGMAAHCVQRLAQVDASS